jgi:predicted phosphodiesterase
MYKYTHFIPENTAPNEAKKIGVYDSKGDKVCNIALGRLKPPNIKKLYSFCALADIHLTYDTANEDFQRALTYAEEKCDFTCTAGDLTSTGSESEMQIFKNIVDIYAPTKPVYAISGNHENYNNYSDKYLEKYTGHPLYYSFTKGNDVFIMVGHYGSWHDGNWQSSEFVSVDELQWLYETLEANRNKRCFVFVHCLPLAHGVGDPCGLYSENSGASKLWDVNDGDIGQAFISLLRHYKNTILFHGHSHTQFKLQAIDPKANYSNADGYKSIHISSLAMPRDKDPDETPKPLEDLYAESEGYIVDVYDNFIVLNGRDFIDNDADGHILPISTYKIDTTLVEIPANTFTDDTGTIKTT